MRHWKESFFFVGLAGRNNFVSGSVFDWRGLLGGRGYFGGDAILKVRPFCWGEDTLPGRAILAEKKLSGNMICRKTFLAGKIHIF